MASIQLRVCGEFGGAPDADDAIDDSVSPRLTTCVASRCARQLAAAALQPQFETLRRRVRARRSLGSCRGVGDDVGEVSCAGGAASHRAQSRPSRAPAPRRRRRHGAIAQRRLTRRVDRRIEQHRVFADQAATSPIHLDQQGDERLGDRVRGLELDDLTTVGTCGASCTCTLLRNTGHSRP